MKGDRARREEIADSQAVSTPPTTTDDEDGGDELGEEEFEIESIIDARVRWAKGKPSIHFRVHWKGYDSDEDSWTPADQFDDDDPPVLEFYKRNPDKPSKAKLAQKTAKLASAKAQVNGTASKVKPTDCEDGVMVLDTPQAGLGVSTAIPKGKTGNFLSFFGGKGGKENRDPSSSKPSGSKAGKTSDKTVPNVKPRDGKSTELQKKKRKVEDDDSDFMMDDSKADPEDDDDDDLQSLAPESGDDKEDDLESEHSAGTYLQLGLLESVRRIV